MLYIGALVVTVAFELCVPGVREAFVARKEALK